MITSGSKLYNFWAHLPIPSPKKFWIPELLYPTCHTAQPAKKHRTRKHINSFEGKSLEAGGGAQACSIKHPTPVQKKFWMHKLIHPTQNPTPPQLQKGREPRQENV